jgi:hypothetical protein
MNSIKKAFSDKKSAEFLTILFVLMLLILFGINELYTKKSERTLQNQYAVEREFLESTPKPVEIAAIEKFCTTELFPENISLRGYETDYHINGEPGQSVWKSSDKPPETFDLLEMPENFVVISKKFEGCGLVSRSDINHFDSALKETERANAQKYICPEGALYISKKTSVNFDANSFYFFRENGIYTVSVISISNYSNIDISHSECVPE